MNKLHKKIQHLHYVLIFAVAFLILDCGAPSLLYVNGVRVEQPSQNNDPEIITLPLARSAAVDSIKLDLVRRGFTIKESDRELGIIQTDDKILAKDEDFERRSSPEQEAACCFGAVLFTGAIAAVAVAGSDKKSACADSKNHHYDDHVSETTPLVVQSKGRLQIIASGNKDTASTTLEITAYLSSYENGVKAGESKAIRLHPFIQKYACLLSHKKCGSAPGQKIITEKMIKG